MLTFSMLSMSLTSCFLLSQKPIPQKSHPMAYSAQGYCDNPTLTNKSTVDLRIARDIAYDNVDEKITHSILTPNEVLDGSGIRFQVGTKIDYHISWDDWKQGDVIKYELRCNDTLEPLTVEISYDNYKRERLYVYESKENKASGLDAIWKYWN